MTTKELLETPLIAGGVLELERLTGLYSQIKEAIITQRLKADDDLCSGFTSRYFTYKDQINELEFKLETCRILLTKFNA